MAQIWDRPPPIGRNLHSFPWFVSAETRQNARTRTATATLPSFSSATAAQTPMVSWRDSNPHHGLGDVQRECFGLGEHTVSSDEARK
jgi:hypothetical protein